jgi:hypothetical protein
MLVLAYLETVSALIPLTRSYALALLGYALRPLEQLGLGLLARVGDLFFILVVVLLARWSIQLLRFLAVESQRGTIHIPGVEPDHSLRLFKLARLVILATAIVTAFPYVPGSDSPAFRGLSLLFGAVFTFGSSGAAANFAGGLLLIFSRLFRTGDRIRVSRRRVIELDCSSRACARRGEVCAQRLASFRSGRLLHPRRQRRPSTPRCDRIRRPGGRCTSCCSPLRVARATCSPSPRLSADRTRRFLRPTSSTRRANRGT